MLKLTSLLAVSLALFASGPAFARPPAAVRHIVITNDDGLTSNVVALYRALKADGYDVIVSVPCTNQSGMGAALSIGRPLAPLTEPCLNDAAKVGDPGAGAMTREGLSPDFYYVAGTPVMALMYGLDIVAEHRWGVAPDLVLSGPNEGQNVGAIILSSGTVSAAQYAAIRGIPAIALSAGSNSVDPALANPVSTIVAARSVELVRALDTRAGAGRLLPHGVALNVNLPDNAEAVPWRLTRIGSYNAYRVRFTTSLRQSASPMMVEMARARGTELPDLPGLSFDMNTAEIGANEVDDESVVYKTAIAVSPMQAGYDPVTVPGDWLAFYLHDLFAK